MRKLLLILILIAMPFSISVGQAMGDHTVAFGGPGYQQRGINLSLGIATPVFNEVWALKYVEVGQYGGGIILDAVVFYKFPSSKWSAGLIGGLGNTWLNQAGDGVSPISYVTSASGLIVSWAAGDKWGVAAHGRYTASMESGNAFEDNYGVGLKIWSDI